MKPLFLYIAQEDCFRFFIRRKFFIFEKLNLILSTFSKNKIKICLKKYSDCITLKFTFRIKNFFTLQLTSTKRKRCIHINGTVIFSTD